MIWHRGLACPELSPGCGWRGVWFGNHQPTAPALLAASTPRRLQKGGKKPLEAKTAAAFRTLRTGAMKTETPVRMKTASPVSLCSLRVVAHVSHEARGSLGHPQPLPAPKNPTGSLRRLFNFCWWWQHVGAAHSSAPGLRGASPNHRHPPGAAESPSWGAQGLPHGLTSSPKAWCQLC